MEAKFDAPSTVAPGVAAQMASSGLRIRDVPREDAKTKLNDGTKVSKQSFNAHNLKWNKNNAASYLEQLKKANQNVICTSKGTKVGKVSIDFLLRQGLRIPLFQRRYCWTSVQWKQLYADATALADGRKSSHSLGRITCVESGEGLVVIDGQQRNTSCVLLLAAVRDVCLKLDLLDDADFVNRVLLGTSYEKELERYLVSKTEFQDGDEPLPGCCLTPTFCDRASFFSAILPPSKSVASTSSWSRPLEAKEYFVERLLKESREGKELKKLATAVLTRFQWLYFPLDVDGTVREDGTTNLNLIFERLALREAMFCRPPKVSMYATMAACDFIRNLLLGSFGDEKEAIKVYERYWLAVERKADEVGKRENVDPGQVMENVLTAFLTHERVADRKRDTLDTMIGGNLYALFRDWALRVQQEGISNLEMIEIVNKYAMEWLEGGNRVVVVQEQQREGEEHQYAETKKSKWSCPRCNFPNSGSSRMCTACSYFKTT